MSNVDKTNAHVRSNADDAANPESVSEEAKRLLDDPAFNRAFDAVYGAMVREISEIRHDGSGEMDAYERECCRTLRTLSKIKKAISLSFNTQTLRLADFGANINTKGDNNG